MSAETVAETVAILVRHAHADWTPDKARPLSAKGSADAARLADRLTHLPVDAVYASPEMRARQTVTPIAERRNLPVHIVNDLRERELSDKPVDDWLAVVHALWVAEALALPGGESNITAQRRGVAALEQLMAAHVGHHIVVGTHGNLLALILQHYDPSVDFDFWRALTMPDAYRLRIGLDRVQYSRINWGTDEQFDTIEGFVMIAVDIPDFGKYDISHLVCDFNGTLAEDGALIAGVQAELETLSRSVQVHVVTADTFGTAQRALAGINCRIHLLRPDDQRHAKLAYVYVLGPQHTICIGNGRNDVDMLRAAAVGIAVINIEGASGEALVAADVVCNSIGDALALIQNKQRLTATLRA